MLNGGGADVQCGKLVLDYTGGTSPAPTVLSLLTTSYATGFASGQIHSSTASTNLALGWNDSPTSHCVTVASALYGDTNLDGFVDGSDYNVVRSHLGQLGGWSQGDFTYDGYVDGSDYNVIRAHLGQSDVRSQDVFISDGNTGSADTSLLTPDPATPSTSAPIVAKDTSDSTVATIGQPSTYAVLADQATNNSSGISTAPTPDVPHVDAILSVLPNPADGADTSVAAANSGQIAIPSLDDVIPDGDANVTDSSVVTPDAATPSSSAPIVANDTSDGTVATIGQPSTYAVLADQATNNSSGVSTAPTPDVQPVDSNLSVLPNRVDSADSSVVAANSAPIAISSPDNVIPEGAADSSSSVLTPDPATPSTSAGFQPAGCF